MTQQLIGYSICPFCKTQAAVFIDDDSPDPDYYSEAAWAECQNGHSLTERDICETFVPIERD